MRRCGLQSVGGRSEWDVRLRRQVAFELNGPLALSFHVANKAQAARLRLNL